MIDDINKKIVFKRLLIYISVAVSLFFVDLLLKDYSLYSDIFHILFAVIIIADIILHLIIIIKDFGVLKFFIVSVNILVKLSLVILYFRIQYDTLFSDSLLVLLYFYIIILGLLIYPVFVMIYMVSVLFKDFHISINPPILIVLLNGVALFILQFFTESSYFGDYGFEYFLYFEFTYSMLAIYFPFVILSFLYVLDLFIENKEKI